MDTVKEYLSAIGRKGGQVTSDRKAKAARRNGRKPKRNFKSRNSLSNPESEHNNKV